MLTEEKLIELNTIRDPRGDLCVAEFDSELPFKIRRYFAVFNVPMDASRGQHAHRVCDQLLICSSGKINVDIYNGCDWTTYVLDRPNLALYIPAKLWAEQYGHTVDAVLTVFASHEYDETDYIRNLSEYEQFISTLS